MKVLFKNGTVVNVFTGSLEQKDVLLEGARIIGVDQYSEQDADQVWDVSGKILCPGLIDGHIHVESTMLQPPELARVCLLHGTTAVVADPHEIANVCGEAGISYLLQSSEGLPLTVYAMLPSCVPSTGFDEAGAVLGARELRPFYAHPRVLGLAEMMNYPGVLAEEQEVLQKLSDAKALNKPIDGHAPLLRGQALDRYIAAGVQSDHECSSFAEAAERIGKGQWVMIRQGTAARNLEALLPLFDPPYCHRCLLVSDDKHPADLLQNGHIDAMIRQAAAAGKSAVTGIQMATIQAAQCFGLRFVGAVAPGYRADLLVLDDLDTMAVRDVYCGGVRVVEGGQVCPVSEPIVEESLRSAVEGSFSLKALQAESFALSHEAGDCRVIRIVPGQLLTEEWITPVSGIDLSRDILKLAVIERHRGTGHMGLGYINGIGLKYGAIASSVSHDSHNLIVIGTNEADMAAAANRVAALGGGSVAVMNGTVLAELPLPIAGLLSRLPAGEVAEQNEILRKTVHTMGVPEQVEPFMAMAFVSLPVIPALKMTTLGLVDVNRQTLVPLRKEA